MQKPNLNKIIADNLDKAKFQSKSNPSLPTNGWLDDYAYGGYISDSAKATQFGQYKRGGGYFPEYHSYAPPRMVVGGPGPGPLQVYFNKMGEDYQNWYSVPRNHDDGFDSYFFDHIQKQYPSKTTLGAWKITNLKYPDREPLIVFDKELPKEIQEKVKQGKKSAEWLKDYQSIDIDQSSREWDEPFIKEYLAPKYWDVENRRLKQQANGGDISIPDLNADKWLTKYASGGVIKDNRGQWAHPGEITEIDSNRITMQGVPYPVLGIGGDGQKIMMYPNQEYSFNEAPVTEIPMKKNGGWLKKYQFAGGVGKPSFIDALPTGTLMKWATHKPTTADLAASVADPTGIANIPFVTNSVRNMIDNPSWGNLADVGWNILGSIPIIGKGAKAVKAAETAEKLAQTASKSRTVGRAIGRPVGKVVRAVDKAVTAPARVVDAGWKAAGVTPILGKTIMNANLWNRGERAYEAGLKGLVEGLNFVSPGQASSEESKSSQPISKSKTNKKPVQSNDRYLESGMITDKGSNVTHVIKNGKVVKSFPVLTGQSRDVNASPYSLDYLEKHPEARATPIGTYFSKPNPNIYGAPGFNMNPISAFGQPAPQASNLAQHVTYGAFGHDPKEYAKRSALYNQEAAKRAGTYGCTNCRKSDINYITSSFPQGDTTMVVDSRREGDLNFLREKYGIKKTGGQINWLNKYK